MTNDQSFNGVKSQKYDTKRPLTPQFKKEMSKSGGEVEGKVQGGEAGEGGEQPKVDLIVLMSKNLALANSGLIVKKPRPYSQQQYTQSIAAQMAANKMKNTT